MGKGGDSANALLLLCIVAFGSVETATPFITPVYVPDEIVIPDLIRGTNSMSDATPVKKAVTAYTSGYLNSYDRAFAAEHFDLVDTNFGLSPATLTAMKAANADLLVIGYKDLIAVKTTDADYGTVTMNEDWFLHDASANRIANTEYGWYLMDPASAGWRAHYVSQVNAAMAAGYDGVFADDCWDDVSDYQSGLTHTVQAADVASWHADMVAFLTYIKANITEGKIVVVNSDEWGDNTYVAVAGARMIEGYCHENWTPVDSQGGRSTATIMTLVDRMVTDLAAGYTVWAHSGSLEGTNSQNAQMLQYCYACYLLGAGTGSYWGYRDWYESDGDGGHGYYALMDTDLGDASGVYASWSGLYKREFAKGLVLFNPSSSAVTVTVDAGYRNVYTGLIEGTSITVPAYGGAILYSPYTVTSSAGTGGTVDPEETSTISYQASKTYTATASSKYVFSHWILDDAVYSSNANPLTFNFGEAGSAYTLQAIFAAIPDPGSQLYYVESYAGIGGSVSPSGASTVAVDTGSITLTATANTGYTFSRWMLNSAVYSTDAAITYNSGVAAAIYVFTAEFTVDYSPETPDPEPPTPSPAPEAVTIFNTALTKLSGAVKNENIWEKHVWTPGVFDECSVFRAVTQRLEKSS